MISLKVLLWTLSEGLTSLDICSLVAAMATGRIISLCKSIAGVNKSSSEDSLFLTIGVRGFGSATNA